MSSRFVGTLNIIGDDSNLSGTALVRVTGQGDPFENATTFLTQDRHLSNGNRIFVIGDPDRIGGQDVINISDAGRELPAVVGAGGVLRAFSLTAKGGGSAGKGAAKGGGAKKSAAKKGGKKGAQKGGGKKGHGK